MVGMLFGFSVNLYLWLGTKAPWTWYVPIGATVTFGIGYAASLLTNVAEKTCRAYRQTLHEVSF